jgi:hypothetical protein
MSERIFGMRRGFALFALVLLYTIAPILSVLIAGQIASSLGCRLDEGDAHPCLCLGVDIGRPLNVMFVSAWFALITLPTGLAGMIALLFGLALSKMR